MTEEFHTRKPANLGYKFGQKRSRKTYDALISAGFRLLEQHPFEDITIAYLAREAGYSIGAFYTRFRSKDEFFSSMLQHHITVRLEANKRILESWPPETVVDHLLSDLVAYYFEHRNFWRATIIRIAPDPSHWQPLRQLGEENARAFVDYLQQARGRPLNAAELDNLRFAFQTVRSIINNTIINNPGPFDLGQEAFLRKLIRAFYLISDYQSLLEPGRHDEVPATS